MKGSIGSFVLRLVAVVVLFAPDGFARDPNSVSLCPPSFKMTGRDGCQPSNDSKSGSLPAPVKDYAAEQLWKEIVALVNDTPSDIQYCVWRGPLRSGWILDGANERHCGESFTISPFLTCKPRIEAGDYKLAARGNRVSG